MSASGEAMSLLRTGLLKGVAVIVIGDGAGESIGAAVRSACEELGARVRACAPARGADAPDAERLMGEEVAAAIECAAGAQALVLDGAALFSEPYAAGEPLQSCMLGCWTAVRAFAAGGAIDAGAGRVILTAPRADAGTHATAAAAGLENLARTLSIEWARYGMSAVAIVPGATTPAGEVAAVIAYLLSPAGAYFSGCVLDLRGNDGDA